MRTAALLVAALLAAACARPPLPSSVRPRLFVVTQVPAGEAGFDPDPRSRYPQASRLVVVDLAKPEAGPHVISSGLFAAGAPAVRSDGGRIAFVAREKETDRFAVWTCAPDGSERTRSAEVAADCGSAAFLADGRLAFSAAVSAAQWAIFVTGAGGGAPQRITFSGGMDLDPTPLPDGRIAFASRAPGAAEFALLSVHVDGTGVAPYRGSARTRALLLAEDAAHDAGAANDPAWRTIECVPLAPQRKPQGHLSVVDPTKTTGDVFCIDVRPPGDTQSRRARFVELVAPPRPLGDVPLEADGSVFVRLPADTPLGLELLDAAGHVTHAQRTPFWVRPGETRGCVGCHEEPDTTPPNVRPIAVLEAAVPLGGVRPAEGSR